MVPILYRDRANDYRFKDGFMWGLIFFGIHLLWMAFVLYEKEQGRACVVVVYATTVWYFALISGFWFWFKNLMASGIMNRIQSLKGKYVALYCTWIVSTVTFIFITCYCSLALFGCFDGYSFVNPLLPIVSWTWYLQPIVYLGYLSYWIIITLINVIIALLLQKKELKLIVPLLALFLFPICFSFQNKSLNLKEGEIGYLKPHWNHLNLTQAQKFYQIGRDLDSFAMNCPDLKFVLLPESSFSHNILDWEDKLDAWSSLFDEKTSILIGTHRYIGGNNYNSLCQIIDGKIVNHYDKSHLIPFVERMPDWARLIPFFSSLFAKNRCFFSYPAKNQKNLEVGGYVPYICSELFCEAKKPVDSRPIIFICNDDWLGLGYARELALRSASLYSLRFGVSIIYVGSRNCSIIK